MLIAVGLDLLLGRHSAIGGLVVLGLTVALIAGVLFWAFRYPTAAQRASAQAMTVREAIGDATSARVELNFGAGRLDVHKAEGKQYLVDGTATNVRKSYAVTDGVGRLELNQDAGRFLFLPPFGDDRRVTWDIGLSGALPLDLWVETGAGLTNIDLTGLSLKKLDLNAGVGQTRVTFPAEGRVGAAISGGVGELLISLSEELPTRMTVSTGLGNFSAPSTFTRRGDVYETQKFSTEGDYLDLTLSLGVGSVVVK